MKEWGDGGHETLVSLRIEQEDFGEDVEPSAEVRMNRTNAARKYWFELLGKVNQCLEVIEIQA